jgi:hypothetical protein
MIIHTLSKKKISDKVALRLSNKKLQRVQSLSIKGQSATCTKKGSGRTHVSGWNKQDKRARMS